MQRRANVCVTLACPRCLSELVVTLDQVHEERTVRCPTCGIPVELEPADLGIPPAPDNTGQAWIPV
jgi:predicted Zn finger-like uncharacterized protein